MNLTWTRTVTRTPIITPTIGLFSRSDFSKKAAKKTDVAMKKKNKITNYTKKLL